MKYSSLFLDKAFSNYKKHNTAKVPIAVSPTGTITFVSKAWDGRVSDKQITEESGFLNLIEPSEVVLAVVVLILQMIWQCEELNWKFLYL